MIHLGPEARPRVASASRHFPSSTIIATPEDGVSSMKPILSGAHNHLRFPL
jgi:hypothetical protein